jgi:hypothetical protein
MRTIFKKTLLIASFLLGASALWAVEDNNSTNTQEDSNTTEKESPWIATPLVSSGPKMGSSVGAMVGYLHKFDEESPTSTFGLTGTYSDTDSYYLVLFATTYFDENTQRLIAALIYGEINNEYLYDGLPQAVKTTDNFYASFIRYSYKVYDNWYVGGQFVNTDYEILGNDPFSNQVLTTIGLSGFSGNGVGLTAEYDTRENINSPQSGSFVNLNNLAYRKAIGSDVDFDEYTLNLRHYFDQHEKLVLAMRLDNRWTHDAPPAGYSSVDLRGYTSGQYIAHYGSVFELEERLDIAYGIGATLFGGVACLYESLGDCSDNIKKEEKMVVRLEGAKGESGSYGIYLQFGRAY